MCLVLSPLPLIFDMRSTTAASGYAEIGLLMAVFGQLAKLYGLPAHCLGMLTDAVIPDAQAGLEKVLVRSLGFSNSTFGVAAWPG